MEKILVLLEHRRNCEVLVDWLSRSYEVAQNGENEELAGLFDLALVDGSALERLQEKLRALKKQTAPIFLPVLLMTNRQNGAATARYLGREVDEVIGTPIDKAELQLRIENLLKMRRLSNDLKQQLETVDRLSITDDVSGFHNTRFLHRYLDGLMERSEMQEEKVSLVFFDMDGFKKVVDTHGHPLGAKVLKEVAEVVNCCLDLEDRIVRYGDDEYVVILPGQDKAEALKKVERMKEGIASTPFLQDEKINVKLTASFGLATYPHDAKDKRELLAAADRCLFQSKERGKNRTTLSGDTPEISC
jgi:diguanylate cyclase (GGDEF)-like protein